MPTYYSAINVPTDTEGFVELLNAPISSYYIGHDGLDANPGTNAQPWLTLSRAFDFVENKRIAKDSIVQFVIKSADGATGWSQKIVSDTEITVRHPDADRIIVKGETPTNLSLIGINYYDSTFRGMGDSVTGGFLMELTVGQNAEGVEVGDFIRITDDNYSSTSRWISGASGPTFLETDFAHHTSSHTEVMDLSGVTNENPPLSLRKTLAFGCHEVVGIDTDAGTSVASHNILVHVRHHNPTENLHAPYATAPGSGLTGPTGAYISPQGLRFTTDTSSFPAVNSSVNTGTAGYVHGNVYGDMINHRLMSNNGVTANNLIPDSAGFTHGATGNYGGWTSGGLPGRNDYGIGVGAAHGASFGGVSGGNSYFWDTSPAQSGHSAAFIGIKVQHIASRINFNSGGGLNIVGAKLGKIEDVVICGPGFDVTANAGVPNSTSVAIKADSGGGLIETSNVSVVGFGRGFQAEDNGVINANGSVVSGCGIGFSSKNNGSINANYAIASGCSQGFYAENQGHIDAQASIATANHNDGFIAQSDSSIHAPFSISCLNGGNGYIAEANSHMRLHLSERETSFHGITTDIYRYGSSDKSGAFAFRNSLSGFKAYDASSIFAPQSRASFNVKSGYEIDKQSTLNAVYSNAWFNGYAEAIGGISSGYQSSSNSSSIINNSNSYHNGKNGFEASVNSLIKNEGGTGDRNQHNAFHAEYLSTIKADSTTSGITNSAGFSAGAPGQGVGAHVGVGFNSVSDSTIFTGTNSSGTSGDATQFAVVRAY